MARRKDHTREEVKELILSAARALVAEGGIEALTARAIATKIGYTAGTIYNVFTDMNDIVLHLNGETLDRLYIELSRPQHNRKKRPPLANMKSMALGYMRFAEENRDEWRILFMLDKTGQNPPPVWYVQKIEQLFKPLEIILAPYFTAMQEKTHKETARTLWGAVHGLHSLAIAQRLPDNSGQRDVRNMIFRLIENFMAGLSVKKNLSGD